MSNDWTDTEFEAGSAIYGKEFQHPVGLRAVHQPGGAVARALAAVAAFHPATVADVRTLLHMWARRNELSDADRTAVLDHYRGRGESNA